MTTTASVGRGARSWARETALPIGKHNQGLGEQLARALRTVWRTLPWLLGCAMLVLGWLFRDRLSIDPERGVGYALGLLTVSCMLVLLFYPLRKRVKALAVFGPTRTWFQIHMTLGALAPLAALYHCGFEVGSLNSQVALFCTLLVAGSGLIGRYLYRHVNQGLAAQRRHLKTRRAKQRGPRPQAFRFLDLVDERLAAFDQRMHTAAAKPWRHPLMLFYLDKWAYREHYALVMFTSRHIDKHASNPVLRRHRARILNSLEEHLKAHLAAVRALARLSVYERLFGLWHIAHLPFFVLLVISAVVHVIAVHVY